MTKPISGKLLPVARRLRVTVGALVVGIAVLAAGDHGERAQLMKESMAVADHRPSAQERDRLRAEVGRAQERGWATIDIGDDVTRVAAALIDSSGRPIGAITVSGPSYRIDPQLDRIAADTIAAATDIGVALGR